MKSAAIFDMDGLLLDTELVYNKEWYKLADKYKLTVDFKMLDEMRGTSGSMMNQIITTYWPMMDAQKLSDELFQNAYKSLSTYAPLKKGALPLLKFLKKNHVALALASSAPYDLIQQNLKTANINDYFDVVVSGEHVKHGKPAPDIFLLAAEKLKKDPKDCYVLEDGIHGVSAGVSAGCATIMVPDQIPPGEKQQQSCIGIFDSLLDVLHALQNGEC